MSELVKIRDISLKYGVSARALKYYEDMGLIESKKGDDYAYRLYDENATKRLEQILILRKLNIKIKDIKRIFCSDDSAIVLEVLGQKVTDINNEVGLLHELKGIVLEFIKQLEVCDFNKESDIKILYEKAKDIEQQILNVNYNGNASSMNHFLDVTKKLDKFSDDMVRIEYLWPMRVLSSYTKKSEGKMTETKENPAKFQNVINNLPKYPRCDHFEFPNPYCEGDMVEIYPIGDDFVNDTEFVDYIFQGGLFATVVTDADKIGDTWKLLLEWIDNSNTFAADTISRGGIREEIFGMPLTPEGSNFYDKHGLPPSIKDIEIPNIRELINRFQWDLLIPIKITNQGDGFRG